MVKQKFMEDYSVLIVNHHLNKFDLIESIDSLQQQTLKQNGFLSN
jgi:hypothetical protein